MKYPAVVITTIQQTEKDDFSGAMTLQGWRRAESAFVFSLLKIDGCYLSARPTSLASFYSTIVISFPFFRINGRLKQNIAFSEALFLYKRLSDNELTPFFTFVKVVVPEEWREKRRETKKNFVEMA